MATTSIRTATVEALRALVETAVDAAEGDALTPVYFGRPDREAAKDSISVGPFLSGSLDIEELTGSRQRRRDRFHFDVVVIAAVPGRSYKEACERAEELWAHIEDETADDPTLGNLDGLNWCITSGEYDGPNAYGTEEGFLAHIVGQCDCDSDLQ